MAEPLLDLEGYALIPGPVDVGPPLYSFAVDGDVVFLSPEEVAAVLLAVPGVRLVRPADPASGAWLARWGEGDRYLELDLTTMPEPEESRLVWGGSGLHGRCTLADLLAIWSALEIRFEGVWLHDPECRMHTPESFARHLAEG